MFTAQNKPKRRKGKERMGLDEMSECSQLNGLTQRK